MPRTPVLAWAVVGLGGCYSAAEQDDIGAIQSDVSSGNTSHDEVLTALTALQADMDALTADVAAIQTAAVALQADVDALTADVAGIAADVDSHTTDLADIQSGVDDVAADLVALSTDVGQVRDAASWTMVYSYDPHNDVDLQGSLEDLAAAVIAGAEVRVRACPVEDLAPVMSVCEEVYFAAECSLVILGTDPGAQDRLVCSTSFVAQPDPGMVSLPLPASVSLYVVSDGTARLVTEDTSEYVVDFLPGDFQELLISWYVRSAPAP